MITPIFKLEQNDEFLIVSIRAPYTNVKNAEIVYEGQTFLFNCKPYFLRLFLPKVVRENDAEEQLGNASYDCDSDTFVVKVPKLNKGEHFPNLEMLSELLAPQHKINEIHAKPLVEELASTSFDGDENCLQEENLGMGESTDELYAEQKLEENNPLNEANDVLVKFGYGFAWRRHGVIGRFQEDIKDLFDLNDPEQSLIEERNALCQQFDRHRFNPDHYLADLFAPDEQLRGVLEFEIDFDDHFALNDFDREQLKNLKLRQLNLFGVNDQRKLHKQICYSVFDIICAYVFDLQITDAEHCVESAWNIAKLSPSLSFLVRWIGAREAAVGFLRRSFVYPLYRHWDLSEKVLNGAIKAIERGRVAMLKCLLDSRRIFNSSGGDCHYLFNQLFLDDMCLWIQSVDEVILQDFISELKTSLERKPIRKAELDLDLDAIELEGRMKLIEINENERDEKEKLKKEGLVDSDDDPDDG